MLKPEKIWKMNDKVLKFLKEGKIEKAKKLIEKGADISAVLDKICSADHGINIDKNIDLVKTLVDMGANANIEELIIYSIEKGDLDFCEYISQHGADFLGKYSGFNHDVTYLECAAKEGTLQVCKWMVEKKGADVSEPWVLRGAVSAHKLDNCKYLIEKGANVNASTGAPYSVIPNALFF